MTPAIDPSDDPTGYLEQLVGRYVTPGTIESVIRTWVPVFVGSVLAWLGVHWHIVFPHGASATFGLVAGGVVIAAYYALARLIERRWPNLGRFLIAFGLVKAKPLYADAAAAPAAHRRGDTFDAVATPDRPFPPGERRRR